MGHLGDAPVDLGGYAPIVTMQQGVEVDIGRPTDSVKGATGKRCVNTSAGDYRVTE
jgi:hypothetical protein